MLKPSKKKKKVMVKKKKVIVKKSVLKEQFAKRGEGKEKKKGSLSELTLEKEEDQEGGENEPFSTKVVTVRLVPKKG